MNRSAASRTRGSLIERAAEAYGLNDVGGHRPARVSTDPPPTAAETPAYPPVAIAVQPAVVEALPPVPGAAPIAQAPVARPPLAPLPPLPPLAPLAPPVVAAPDALQGDPAPAGVAVIDREQLAEQGMIVPGAAISVLAEEFRLVKRQLLLTARKLDQSSPRARTILVASARPNEGKTFCAINLGISLAAERETRVLLIDGDFAKRDLMPRLGLQNGKGFLDLLDDAALEPEALVVRTDVPGLSLLGAGTRTHDDTELLASGRTRIVLDQLLEADPARIVIFDSPPVLAASPASVFALLAGQVMMVVRADSTGENEIREGVALLDGCEHIQLVLNQVRHRPEGYRFGDYYSPSELVK